MNGVGTTIEGIARGRLVTTYWLWTEADTDVVKAACDPHDYDVIPFDRLREWTEPSGAQVVVQIRGDLVSVPKAPLALMVRRILWYALECPGRYPE